MKTEDFEDLTLQTSLTSKGSLLVQECLSTSSGIKSCVQRVIHQETKTEDSTPKTSSTSKGESVGAVNVC
ncbi:hypothetical protein Hanom_Chr07g00633241 [Helianthus anomalus]